MKIQTALIPAFAAVILPMLASCASSPTATGLDPYERADGVKRRPLSDDPNSAMSKMQAADGQVGMKVAEF